MTAPPSTSYRMRPALVAVLFAGAFAAASIAITLDTPGRLLFGCLAVVALAEAVRGLRPALTAGDDGITVATLTGHRHHPWSDVASVAPMALPSSGRRLRRTGNALEIDLGDRLVVVPGYRLGATVDDVVAALEVRRNSLSVS